VVLAAVLCGACKSDPAVESLNSFREYVAREFPGGAFTASRWKEVCTLRSDVVKTASVASPYEGVLSGVMTMERVLSPVVPGQKAEPLQGPLRGVVKFQLHFARDGSTWTCDGTKGFRTFQQDDGPETRVPDPCASLPPACRGQQSTSD
jgi:hypothetical protein